MKIKKSEIKSVYVVSPSPLVVNITHTDGSSEQSNLAQINRAYTEEAKGYILEKAKGG